MRTGRRGGTAARAARFSKQRIRRSPRRSGAFSAPACFGLLLATASALGGQEQPAEPESRRLPLLEIRFAPGSIDTGTVLLERGVVYRVQLSGPGRPVVRQRDGSRPRDALLVAVERDATTPVRAFEVYAYVAGPHLVTVTDVPAGASGTLQLFEDEARTRQTARRRDRRLAPGALVAGGFHTGYRLDPTGGADPRGGTDLEGCLLVEAYGWLGTCVGVGKQSMPDAGYAVWWAFLEGRARLLSRQLLGDRRTDLGVALRLSQGLDAGPRALDPLMLSVGLYVTQHLTGGGLRRGWSVFGAWYHGRLGNAPETELRDADRLTAGLIWIP